MVKAHRTQGPRPGIMRSGVSAGCKHARFRPTSACGTRTTSLFAALEVIDEFATQNGRCR
jgi:hypothetical protein